MNGLVYLVPLLAIILIGFSQVSAAATTVYLPTDWMSVITTTSDSNTVCSTTVSSTADDASSPFNPQVFIGTDTSTFCKHTAVKFDISSLPDNAFITEIKYNFTEPSFHSFTALCDLMQMQSDPETLSDQDMLDDALNGTKYIDTFNCDYADGGTASFTMSNAVEDLSNALLDDIFSVGLVIYDGHVRTSFSGSSNHDDPVLEVTYLTPPDPPKQFSGDPINWYGANMTWSAGEVNDDTHTDYTIEYWNGASWVSEVTQGGTTYLDNDPPDDSTGSWRIKDNGGVAFGCYQPLLNATLVADLESHWPLCYSVNDNGIQDNDGSVTGTEVYHQTTTDGSFLFDGSSYITIGNENTYDRTATEPFTIAMWIKSDNDDESDIIFSKGTISSGDGFALWRWVSNNHITFSFINGGTNISTDFTSAIINDGDWHHIALTKDSSANRDGLTGYYDGVAVGVGASQSITSLENTASVILGAETGGTNPFDGELKDVMWLDVELDAAAISQLYNEHIDTRWKPEPINDLTATIIDLDTVQLDFTSTSWLSETCYDINYTTPLGTPISVAQSCASPAASYFVNDLDNFANNYSFRMGAVNNYGTNSTGNIANTTGFNPFEIGNINIPEGNNTVTLPIQFVEYSVNSTQTDLQVVYDSTMALACDVDYEFGRFNQTYTGLTENALTGTTVYTNFTFNNPANEIINVYCWDTLNDDSDGRYLISQPRSSIPFFTQIDDFRSGSSILGTDGMFGIFDFATLIVVVVSMIAFNRYNPQVGVFVMFMFLGALTYYDIIAWQSSLIGVSALVAMLVVIQVRKP